jgi:SAM-dependent methyltransferase
MKEPFPVSDATVYDPAQDTEAESGAAGGEPVGGVPDHVKAQYPDRAFFDYRELFVRHLMRALSSHLQRPGAATPTCLDIGCNAGRYTQMLARHGMAARGVDFDAALVADARATHPALAFDQGDAGNLPYESDRFDGIVSLGLIQCLPDWRRALSEAVRVLKPGGMGVVETNRAFPLWEVLLKGSAYAIRRRMTFPDLRVWCRAHTVGGERPIEEGLRKFSRRDLLECLQTLPVSSVILHDPRKHWVLHDFMWAVAFVKRAPAAPETETPAITCCRHCRRRGVVHIRTIWTS